MDDIVEIKTQLADHEARIKNVEDGQDDIRENLRNTLRLVSEMETRNNANMRDVRDELKEELAKMNDEAHKRDQETRKVVAEALKKTKRKMPDWGIYVFSVLICLAGSGISVWVGIMVGKALK